jgi:kinesin family member C1
MRPAPATATKPRPGAIKTGVGAGRPIAGSSRVARTNNEDPRYKALQEQVSSIESARAADAARLAALMEAEQKKLEGMQADHQTLSRELAESRTAEMTQRRELVTVNDALEAAKRTHANERMDLEAEIRRKARDLKELQEDLNVCQEDLEREREACRALKTTVGQQATVQLTLTTQITALQAQLSALQSALEMSCNSSSQLKLELEAERKLVAELEERNRAAEKQRRKLHNMVQELKVHRLFTLSHSRRNRFLIMCRAIFASFVVCDPCCPLICHPTTFPRRWRMSTE